MPDTEAEIKGSQRKIVTCRVAPARAAWGDEGIPSRGGVTLPFVVAREWSAPAGHYAERWFIVVPDTREVLYAAPPRDILVWGLQALTQVTDTVSDPIPLAPGTYRIAFALDDVLGGEFDFDVVDAGTEAA